jgi:hypothetical protein
MHFKHDCAIWRQTRAGKAWISSEKGIPSRKTKTWRSEYEEKLLGIWERYKVREVGCEAFASTEGASMDYIERRFARSVAGLLQGRAG